MPNVHASDHLKYIVENSGEVFTRYSSSGVGLWRSSPSDRNVLQGIVKTLVDNFFENFDDPETGATSFAHKDLAIWRNSELVAVIRMDEENHPYHTILSKNAEV